MKGCRPLTEIETKAVLEALGKTLYPKRNQALFMVGLKTGFRISELLSLRVSNVFHGGNLTNEIGVARRYMKKKREGRTVPFLNEEARGYLQAWLTELGTANPDRFLFPSREGENEALDRRSAWSVLTKAFDSCSLSGKLATHTMRKTFAKEMHELLGGNLHHLQVAMGHADINSTTKYIQVDEKKIMDAFGKL